VHIRGVEPPVDVGQLVVAVHPDFSTGGEICPGLSVTAVAVIDAGRPIDTWDSEVTAQNALSRDKAPPRPANSSIPADARTTILFFISAPSQKNIFEFIHRSGSEG
jgi:hypothetical protein